VEILRVHSFGISLQDLAELEHYENLKEAHLRWSDGPSVKEALPILKRCTNLRRLTLKKWGEPPFPSSQEFCDFLLELKHLIFLHFICNYIPNCDHFKSLVDKVKAFGLPRHPNFKFYVSCCSKFPESRVPGEFDL
jgi:hypothetical protein